VCVREAPVNLARKAAAANRSGSARDAGSPAGNNNTEVFIH
jgi:hypothetical protein